MIYVFMEYNMIRILNLFQLTDSNWAYWVTLWYVDACLHSEKAYLSFAHSNVEIIEILLLKERTFSFEIPHLIYLGKKEGKQDGVAMLLKTSIKMTISTWSLQGFTAFKQCLCLTGYPFHVKLYKASQWLN